MIKLIFKIWLYTNGVLLLCSLGLFHAGMLYATIMTIAVSGLPLIDLFYIFLFTLPFNSFLIFIVHDEVTKARK